MVVVWCVGCGVVCGVWCGWCVGGWWEYSLRGRSDVREQQTWAATRERSERVPAVRRDLTHREGSARRLVQYAASGAAPALVVVLVVVAVVPVAFGAAMCTRPKEAIGTRREAGRDARRSGEGGEELR